MLAVVLVLSSNGGGYGETPQGAEFHSPSDALGEAKTATGGSSLTERVSLVPLGNALGDVNADGLVNLLDVLRARDIAIGAGPSPTQQELAEGDLDRSGSIDLLDVENLRNVVVRLSGLPHVIDGGGGAVEGAGFRLLFAPGEIGAPNVLAIDPVSSADLEQRVGVDFAALGADSSFYMSGFDLTFEQPDFVWPPAMEISLDVLPPCELQGSNLLMAGRRGPTGNTELVMLAELEVVGPNNLASPAPPYPTLSLGARGGSTYSPFEIVELEANNVSFNLASNTVVFESWDGTAAWMHPTAFLPAGVSEPSEIMGIRVPVPWLPSGPASVYLRHNGTGLQSGTIAIDIAPVPTPSVDADSLLAAYFETEVALHQAGLDLLAASGLKPELKAYLLGAVDLRETAEEVEAALLADPDLASFRETMAGAIESSGVIAAMEQAIAGVSGQSAQIDPETEQFLDSVFWVSGITATIITCGLATGGLGIGLCAVALAGSGWSFYRFASSGELLQGGARVQGGAPGRWYSHATMLNTVGGSQPLLVDPSFEPRGYPGFCINIWQHNTNARGSVLPDAGGGDGCDGDQCCSAGGGSGAGGGCGGDGARGGLAPEFRESPLKHAIVTPTNGGIPGIVGIVDGAGSFAIPGLAPGQEIHFAVYDPKSGLFDPDAGSAVAPNVSEQGAWFNAPLLFSANDDIETFGLAIGEAVFDSVRVAKQRFEYVVFVGESEVGRQATLGFCADEPLRFEIVDPLGQTVLLEGDSDSVFQDSLVFGIAGAYVIKVAFGLSQQEARFSLGLSEPGHYPLEYVGCNACDVLPDTFEVPRVFRATEVCDGGLSLEAGSTIEFVEGGTLTGGPISGQAGVSLRGAGSGTGRSGEGAVALREGR